MTNPDTALDLDALTALEKAATPAPWSLEHEGGCIVFGPESSVAEADPADAALIAAARNALPALLSALAAARAERDHYLRSFKAQQAENERVHGKVREQYDVIEHAKKQRDEAIEQAKQAQAVVAAARAAVVYILETHPQIREAQPGWFHESTLRLVAAVDALAACGNCEGIDPGSCATHTAAPQADDDEPFDCAPECRCGRGKPKADEPKPTVCPAEYTRPGGRQRGDRIVRCHLPYGHGGEHEEAETECTWLDAEPDPATVLRSGPCATANCAFCTRDDCGCPCHDVTHAAPVPAGGEDGSGTADGGVPA